MDASRAVPKARIYLPKAAVLSEEGNADARAEEKEEIMPKAGDTRPCQHASYKTGGKCDGIQTYTLQRPFSSVLDAGYVVPKVKKYDGWECSEFGRDHFDRQNSN